MLRNQRREGGIPKLLRYAQLVIAAHPNEVRYAPAGTPEKFWSVWKEEGADLDAVLEPLLDGEGGPTAAASEEEVLAKVCKRARWIVKQQAYRCLQERVLREYVSGETHRYMGRQYRLKVIQIAEEEQPPDEEFTT